MAALRDFFEGSPAEYEQFSNLTPSQLKGQRRLEGAARGRGAGGAHGEAADYWRDILSNNPEAFAAFEAPQQRQFNEQIIPDLAEQFAGMGSGGLDSSGFRNAAIGAGTDLSERLASLRAGLRQNAAQSLFGVGQAALTPHAQYQQTSQGSQGFLPAFGQAAGAALPGLISGGLSGGFGSTSPYGSGTAGLQGMSGAVQGGMSQPFNPIGRR